MFRKLLSSLAFSPGMIDQLYSYLRQKRQECTVRYQAMLILPVFAIFGFATVLFLNNTPTGNNTSLQNDTTIESNVSSKTDKKITVARVYPDPKDNVIEIKSGDVVSFKISATNDGKDSFTEDLVLDLSSLANQASIIDGAGAVASSSDNPLLLTWPKQSLGSSQEIIRTVLVQFKKASATSVHNSVPITFGNTVSLELQTSSQWAITKLTNSLPTLPKQHQAAVILLVITLTTYCYIYTLLIVKEIEAASAEFEHVTPSVNSNSKLSSSGPDQSHAYKTVLHAIRSALPASWHSYSVLVHFKPIEGLSELLTRTIFHQHIILTSLLVATTGMALLYFYASLHQIPISGSETMIMLVLGGFLGAVFELINKRRSEK